MSVMIPVAEDSGWYPVSNAILQIAELTSLDRLLEQALDAWIEKLPLNLRWQIAIELYTTEEISSGRAAEIAGLNYFVFLKKLKEAGIKFIAAEVSTTEEKEHQKELIRASFDLTKT